MIFGGLTRRSYGLIERVLNPVGLSPSWCKGCRGPLCAVSHRWFSRVPDGLADPLWALGAAATPPGQRAQPQAALDAAAAATLRPGDQDRAASAPGGREAPRGVRHLHGHRTRASATGLADQHGLRGADQPDHPLAYGGGGTAGQHAMQGRRRLASAAELVSRVL